MALSVEQKMIVGRCFASCHMALVFAILHLYNVLD